MAEFLGGGSQLQYFECWPLGACSNKWFFFALKFQAEKWFLVCIIAGLSKIRFFLPVTFTNLVFKRTFLYIIFDSTIYKTITVQKYLFPDASLIVPDFTIYVFGSSCNFWNFWSRFFLFLVYRFLIIPSSLGGCK